MRPSGLTLRLTVLAALLTGLIVAMPGSAVASPCPNQDAMPGTIGISKVHKSVLCLINRERRTRNLHRLHRNRRLARSAYKHSREMTAMGYFAHESADGSSFLDRIDATGYLSRASMWAVGENIAWGTSTLSSPEALVEAWMQSTAHRHNILSPRFRAIGLGSVANEPFDPAVTPAITITTDFGFRHR